MAKKQGRASRQQHRVRAKEAEARGLPQADEAPLPARLRPQLRDESGTLKRASYSPTSRGEAQRKAAEATAARGGLPTVAKVAIGALLILGGVFAASQFRKSSSGAISSVSAIQAPVEEKPAPRPTQPEAESAKSAPKSLPVHSGNVSGTAQENASPVADSAVPPAPAVTQATESAPPAAVPKL